MPPDLDHYRRLLIYDAWANAETLASLRRAGGPPRAVRWLAHIAGAGFLWLARLREEPPTLAVWPELDLDGCAARLEQLADEWMHYLDGLQAEDTVDGVGYRNTKGEFWTSKVGDILIHVALHGCYHRGQIAAAVRESGHEPAYTDFIHAVRQGLIE